MMSWRPPNAGFDIAAFPGRYSAIAGLLAGFAFSRALDLEWYPISVIEASPVQRGAWGLPNRVWINLGITAADPATLLALDLAVRGAAAWSLRRVCFGSSEAYSRTASITRPRRRGIPANPLSRAVYGAIYRGPCVLKMFSDGAPPAPPYEGDLREVLRTNRAALKEDRKTA